MTNDRRFPGLGGTLFCGNQKADAASQGNPAIRVLVHELSLKYQTCNVANYEVGVIDNPGKNSHVGLVSNSMMDDVRFADLCFEHGFTDTQSISIVSFIKKQGLMAKLQVYYMLKSPGFSPADLRNLEEALLRESVSHKNAFRAQIKSKDYYPKR